MKCLDKDLTREQIFERIDKYSLRELTPKQETNFEKHILKCDSCHNKLLLHQLTLQVVKKYGDEIFSEAKESPQEGKQILTHEPMQEQKTTLWFTKDGKKLNQIPIQEQDISWSIELFKAGIYALIYLIGREKHILWQKRITPTSPRGRLLGERLYSAPQPEIETIQIPTYKGGRKKEVIVSLEQKNNRLILSLSVKKS